MPLFLGYLSTVGTSWTTIGSLTSQQELILLEVFKHFKYYSQELALDVLKKNRG